jgi:uncharacterized protein YdaU (DUF1376 family)
MEEVKIPKKRRVNDVKMGFFCQHKMMEVQLRLDVAVEAIETAGKHAGERKKLTGRNCDHQDDRCGGCREIERIKAKLEFFDL